MAAPAAVAAVKAIGPKRILQLALAVVLVMFATLGTMLSLPVVFAIALGSGGTLPTDSASASPVISGDWALPVTGYTITDDFGPRAAPCAYCSTLHWGMDMGSGCNAPVYATSSGTIAKVGEEGSYGFRIMIDHPGAVQTLYAHLALGSATVSPGDTVQAGTVIAREGTTGMSTGCHLHFETRLNGERINPVPFLQAHGITL
ncbi:M23 family metallopeptidase [Cryobacterium sp. Sr8]|uniref:M23 family metallopeptidase n=1 Tax=Cryobacterium sp. Sr8 TaxID=1259203 RepID=UPI001069D9F0|nr:M23 family metallopeptidase [Cryobacterium sp. Sr8]TFD76740.1 M23 family metallopeptidase [Cryobacterium sp. Sr8]